MVRHGETLQGYDYTPPSLAYKPETTWGAWDLANAQYNGGRLERSFFDNIVRLYREYESSPTAVTHKTNVHSSDPTA
ncbi:hypothetical protein I309_03670 [Cryptococcus deuterogattii LA55]|nr:hypothetical protein I309_03670 [Cryptococcus deuterogattii LA55]KIR90316.1 hypothetical protein I304_05892 [Cryptococcus deuterogattii CBS 10090]KIR97004.1 hypothetical protein L804_05662 [Cryptococcus deuterogattii 2001/935-1]